MLGPASDICRDRRGRSAASYATHDARRITDTPALVCGVCHPRPDHLNPPPIVTRTPNRRAIATAAVAGLIAIAAGIVLSYRDPLVPGAGHAQAKNTDRLYHVLVIASIPIFVLVVTVILFSVWQFRMKPGEELKDGPPIHGNTRLEVFWTAIPAALLLGLVSYSFVVLHENEKKPAGVPEIQIGVTGQQFFWTYEYPSSVTGGSR